jgi:hypothetical protein
VRLAAGRGRSDRRLRDFEAESFLVERGGSHVY